MDELLVPFVPALDNLPSLKPFFAIGICFGSRGFSLTDDCASALGAGLGLPLPLPCFGAGESSPDVL